MENNLEMDRYKMFGQYGQYSMNNCIDKQMQCGMGLNNVNMPPYMYGKCLNPYENTYMPMNQPMSNINCPYRGEYNMYSVNNYQTQAMEPIENMNTKLYKFLINHVQKAMQKILTENMGVMPKAISKEKYNKSMNYMISEVMKQEDEIKQLVVIDRNETEEKEDTTRDFCPYCNGMLQTTLSTIFIIELLRAGCAYCY